MRLAVVSDIHGNLPALQAVAAEIEAAAVDAVLDLGDIASGPLWPRQTLDWLMARSWPTVAGNHERQALAATPATAPGTDSEDAFTAAEISAAQRAWLAALPTTLDAAGGVVHAFHASPGDDLRPLLETVVPGFAPGGHPGIRAATEPEMRRRLGGHVPAQAQVLLCGHTHVPRAVWLDGRLIVNPGSVGRPAFDDDHPLPYVVENTSPHARWALLVCTDPSAGAAGWQVQLRVTAYDWAASARRAQALGFADWARQLRTGRA
jgi:predicted phosphodiesterase